MERLPTFEANIRAQLEGATNKADALDELLKLACPECGHITPDHTWNPSITDDLEERYPCLVTPPCPCSGNFDAWMTEDAVEDATIIAETNALIASYA